MSRPITTFAAALAVEMRAPLARIELLASQLLRETGSPRARSLAGDICEAVGELDQLIARSLTVLAPESRQPNRYVDLWPVLSAVWARVGAALAARGMHWPAPVPGHAVVGDPELACQGILHLLREVVGRVGHAEPIEMALADEPSRYGILLWIGSPSEKGESGDVAPLSTELQNFSLTHQGIVESEKERGREIIRLWFARDTVECSES